MSSTSFNFQVANEFALTSGGSSVLVEIEIPVEKIFSTAVTGNGGFTESEIVVLGGKYKCRYIADKASVYSDYYRKISPYAGGIK